MNKVSTGNKIDEAIDPMDTVLVNNINTIANTIQIKAIYQLITNNTPKAVSTPFPPLN